MCYDQLPPTSIHVEPEKKVKSDNQFDHFPSMHKNNHGRISIHGIHGTAEEPTKKIDLTNSESQSRNIKEKVELLTEGQDITCKVV